jgi:hypothetical protein
MNSLDASRMVGGNSAYGRAKSDFYPTPADATLALVKALALPRGTRIWEPACGEGHMVKVLKQCGYSVLATDISMGANFLTKSYEPCDWIITNPPFSIADKFIERCLYFDRPFALLLKSHYWHAKKRLSLFRRSPPSVLFPLTWRPDFLFKTRGGGSPLMDVMWCVWSGADAGTPPLYIPLERPSAEEIAEVTTDG